MQVFLVRRSDLRPTRIMGVVGQKCKTSGYHCTALAEEIRKPLDCLSLPCPSHSLGNWGSRWRSIQREDRSQGMKEVEGDRTLLDRLYPIKRARRFSRLEHDWYG